MHPCVFAIHNGSSIRRTFNHAFNRPIVSSVRDPLVRLRMCAKLR